MYNDNNDTNYSGYDYTYRRAGSYREPEPKEGLGTGKKILLSLIMGACFGFSAIFVFFLGNQVLEQQGISILSGVTAEPVPESTLPQEIPAEEAAPQVSASGIETTDTNRITAVVSDVTQVVEEVMPSVVSITNTSLVTERFWGQSYQTEIPSSGSGIIVGENESELLIVTNHHVVADTVDLKVQFIDETVAAAKVKGADAGMDLAVIAVKVEELDAETRKAISIAKLGNSDSLKVGEPAIAIGNALGYGQSVTTGVISALDRQIEIEESGTSGTLIQTDAAINPGNSGGALLNVKGEVIGINSNKIGGSTIEGMGYAIPISGARPIIEDLMSRETKDKVDEAKKGYLGISGLNVSSEVSKMYGMPEGVFVAQVYDGSAAQKAGMMKGDVIVEMEGYPITVMQDLVGYLDYYEAGETVKITVQRGNAGDYEEFVLQVVLGTQDTIPNE